MCVCVWVCACVQGRGVSRPRPRHSSSPMVNMCSSDSSHWWVWDVEDANQSGADQEFPTGASFFSPSSPPHPSSFSCECPLINTIAPILCTVLPYVTSHMIALPLVISQLPPAGNGSNQQGKERPCLIQPCNIREPCKLFASICVLYGLKLALIHGVPKRNHYGLFALLREFITWL